jgi:CIC family chloride channel protein
MRPLRTPLSVLDGQSGEGDGQGPGPLLPGPVTREYDPQVLFSNESVAQALRQLEVYGHDGLPVMSPDGQQILGWVTGAGVLRAIAHLTDPSRQQAPEAQLTAEWALSDPESARDEPPAPLPGYQILEITIPDGSSAVGQPLGAITWPHGWTPVSLARGSQPGNPGPERILSAGDRIKLLAPPSP